MILFLNFAPIAFGGGAEKWVASVAESLSKDEEVVILHMDASIANLYSNLVLGRNFDSRISDRLKNLQIVSITLKDIITSKFSNNRVNKLLNEARIIYSRYELNEYFLLKIFGDKNVLKKTVFGLHSPFKYTDKNLNTLQKLHNWLYMGSFTKKILEESKKVHVLNSDQEKLLKTYFGLSNIKRTPNYIENKPKFSPLSDKNNLNICFIGELSTRKGADILLEVIEKSASCFKFRVAGDGRLKEKFLAINKPNVQYYGFVDPAKIDEIISKSDVLFMPSKAESFSLSCLEALSHGLTIIGNKYLTIEEIKDFLIINKSGKVDMYIKIFKKLFEIKKQSKLENIRKKTWKEINDTYSKQTIISQIQRNFFIN